jgi:hypothetical protein
VRTFHCDHCENLVFFENTHCLRCGHLLAFLPGLMEIASLDPVDESTWQSPHPAASGRTYRLCANYSGAQVCNWALDAARADTLCASCQLTTTIPDLTVEGQHNAWYKLEAAKRRLVYTLMNLRLPIEPRAREPHGLAFEFLADVAEGQPPVAALSHYYANGPAADWRTRFVSAYASAHPWGGLGGDVGALPAHRRHARDRRGLRRIHSPAPARRTGAAERSRGRRHRDHVVRRADGELVSASSCCASRVTLTSACTL